MGLKQQLDDLAHQLHDKNLCDDDLLQLCDTLCNKLQHSDHCEASNLSAAERLSALSALGALLQAGRFDALDDCRVVQLFGDEPSAVLNRLCTGGEVESDPQLYKALAASSVKALRGVCSRHQAGGRAGRHTAAQQTAAQSCWRLLALTALDVKLAETYSNMQAYGELVHQSLSSMQCLMDLGFKLTPSECSLGVAAVRAHLLLGLSGFAALPLPSAVVALMRDACVEFAKARKSNDILHRVGVAERLSKPEKNAQKHKRRNGRPCKKKRQAAAAAAAAAAMPNGDVTSGSDTGAGGQPDCTLSESDSSGTGAAWMRPVTLPASQRNGVPWMVIMERDSRTRCAALGALNSICSHCGKLLMAAAAEPSTSSGRYGNGPRTSTFAPLAHVLGGSLSEAHSCLRLAVNAALAGNEPMVTARLAKSMAIMAGATPFARMQPSLLQSTLDTAECLLRQRDVNVRVASLGLTAAVLPAAVAQPRPGAQQCGASETLRERLVASGRWHQFLQLAADAALPIPLRLEAMQTLTAMVQVFPIDFRAEWSYLFGEMMRMGAEYNIELDLHCARCCLALLHALQSAALPEHLQVTFYDDLFELPPFANVILGGVNGVPNYAKATGAQQLRPYLFAEFCNLISALPNEVVQRRSASGDVQLLCDLLQPSDAAPATSRLHYAAAHALATVACATEHDQARSQCVHALVCLGDRAHMAGDAALHVNTIATLQKVANKCDPFTLFRSTLWHSIYTRALRWAASSSTAARCRPPTVKLAAAVLLARCQVPLSDVNVPDAGWDVDVQNDGDAVEKAVALAVNVLDDLVPESSAPTCTSNSERLLGALCQLCGACFSCLAGSPVGSELAPRRLALVHQCLRCCVRLLRPRCTPRLCSQWLQCVSRASALVQWVDADARAVVFDKVFDMNCTLTAASVVDAQMWGTDGNMLGAVVEQLELWSLEDVSF